MKTLPWRKLWRSTANDEKLRSMITRYGHECSWVWTCLLTQADDSGALESEMEDLAYLTILDANRLAELLAVFARKGLITVSMDQSQDYPVVHVQIAHWDEYQKTESDSAPRVRRFREREAEARLAALTGEQSNDAELEDIDGQGLEENNQENDLADYQKEAVTTPLQKRYGNDKILDIRSKNLDTHTQENITRAQVFNKKIEDKKPQGESLDFKVLYNLWKTIPNAPPLISPERLASVYGKDLTGILTDIPAYDVYHAVKNYAAVKTSDGVWWTSNPDMVTWAKKHIARFLPGSFMLESFKTEETLTSSRGDSGAATKLLPGAVAMVCDACGTHYQWEQAGDAQTCPYCGLSGYDQAEAQRYAKAHGGAVPDYYEKSIETIRSRKDTQTDVRIDETLIKKLIKKGVNT